MIPFLKADKTVDLPDKRLPECEFNQNRLFSQLMKPDIPELVDGLPCTVQVVARGEQDEELMSAVEVISQALAK